MAETDYIRLNAVSSIVQDPDTVLSGIYRSGLGPWKSQEETSGKIRHRFEKLLWDVG